MKNNLVYFPIKTHLVVAHDLSHVVRKPVFSWFPTKCDINRAVQPQRMVIVVVVLGFYVTPTAKQRMVRSLKFKIKEEEGLYYVCSENKGTDQLRS